MTDKIYYVPTAGQWDTVFFEQSLICVDREEAERLATEWSIDFDDLWEEACRSEIAEYGVYDS